MSDFNVNLIKGNKNRGKYEFLEQLFNHNFTPQSTLPTWITEKTATLIYNVLVNDQAQSIILGISQRQYQTIFPIYYNRK